MILLSPLFWFNLRPGSMAQIYSYSLMGLIIFLIIAAVILFIAKRKKGFYKKSLENFYNFSLTNALFGALLLFFNYELVPFFSARFWFLIWLVVAVIWLYYTIKALKKVAIRKKQNIETDEIKKYLP
jgi:nitrate/nitrite transporter NarK